MLQLAWWFNHRVNSLRATRDGLVQIFSTDGGVQDNIIRELTAKRA